MDGFSTYPTCLRLQTLNFKIPPKYLQMTRPAFHCSNTGAHLDTKHTPLRGGLLAVGELHFGVSTDTSGRTLQEKRGSEGGGRKKEEDTNLSYVLERGNAVANVMVEDVTYSP